MFFDDDAASAVLFAHSKRVWKEVMWNLHKKGFQDWYTSTKLVTNTTYKLWRVISEMWFYPNQIVGVDPIVKRHAKNTSHK